MSHNGDPHDLQKENASLNEQVRRLTAELHRVEAERVEYLQNVSHQLVAPLNAIKWHIENLTANRVSIERAKKVLRSIYSQATVTVHLAKNFVLMSSLEGDHTLKALREPLEPVDLTELLVNLADDFQPLGWDKELTIGVEEASFQGVPDVLVIKPLIAQVFSNIIENAIKYSNNKTSIQISGAYHKMDDTVDVKIKNRGIGIGATDIDRIFDRGYRGQNAKGKYPAGTGFGLFIARKIVAIHMGSIAASTSPLGQTVFEVRLPVHKLQGLTKQWPKKQS